MGILRAPLIRGPNGARLFPRANLAKNCPSVRSNDNKLSEEMLEQSSPTAFTEVQHT